MNTAFLLQIHLLCHLLNSDGLKTENFISRSGGYILLNAVQYLNLLSYPENVIISFEDNANVFFMTNLRFVINNKNISAEFSEIHSNVQGPLVKKNAFRLIKCVLLCAQGLGGTDDFL